MDISFFLLLHIPIEWYLDFAMVNQKLIIFSSEIEAFVDHWGRSIVGDLENGGQADADYVGQLFEVS